ncbi:MAG: hypothetical protein QY317_10055 [Candidatus Jettenia caeni]|nr:MAG: hypothetical protein QY317_10055 [Candidatus Jettenia caeni]
MQIVDINLLQRGINWWLSKNANWDKDFLNSFYSSLYQRRPKELNLSWWKETVDKLWEWKAIRSQRPPNTKKEIFERGSERLLRINEIYKQIHINNNREPTIRDVSWEDMALLHKAG